MKNQPTSVTTFRKGALSGVFFNTLSYFGLAAVMVFTARIFPLIKAYTDVAIAAPRWVTLVAALGLIVTGYAIAAYQFQKRILKLKAENEIDELTGFKNYKALNAELLRLQTFRSAEEEPIALILLDIDNFKQLNDKHSYETADNVLMKLGAILRRDSRITDETYRYFLRGDEFLIVARMTNLENAKKAADRKRRLIREAKILVDGVAFDLTVSCGITAFHNGESKNDVLERLGRAVQQAKLCKGKNATVVLARKSSSKEVL